MHVATDERRRCRIIRLSALDIARLNAARRLCEKIADAVEEVDGHDDDCAALQASAAIARLLEEYEE